MKAFILIFCVVCTVFASLEEERQQWTNFKSIHNKSYKNVQEEKLRFSIFEQNLRAIEEHNQKYEAGKATYKKGVNQFTDWTKEEINSYVNRHNNTRPHFKNSKSVYQRPKIFEAPESIDWRDYGAVSPIKDQGDCGSCWAFSVTGTVEGFYYLNNNEMITFSEQQLLDCSTESDACDGYWEWDAMDYVKQYGLQTEDNYPYEQRQENCRYDESGVVARITDFVYISDTAQDDLLEAVGLVGPTSTSFYVTDDFFAYQEGVYTNDDCDQYSNHAILVVGYGKDEATGLEYWLVKNSWGVDWGDQGYFKIRRGLDECRIEEEVLYPV